MKNPNFVDPVTFLGISRQEIFTMLKERINPESLAWLDYITDEVVLSHDEAMGFESFIIGVCDESTVVDGDYTNLNICKPALLFDRAFFPIPDTEISELSISTYINSRNFLREILFHDGELSEKVLKPRFLGATYLFNEERMKKGLSLLFAKIGNKEIFRTYLFNEERIKSLSLLFAKIGNKETFYPWVSEILESIKLFCTQNKEFAQAYQAKLAEMRSGPLRERWALYVNYYNKNYSSVARLIKELEQPALVKLKEYVNWDWKPPFLEYRKESYLMIDFLFVSLLLNEDQIQIPCWNGEDFICRLLLDYGIINRSIGIVDALCRNNSIFDIFQIVCIHVNWRKNNIPQFEKRKLPLPEVIYQKIKFHFGEFLKYLEVHIPEMFSFDMPDEYRDLLYAYFFRRFEGQDYLLTDYVEYCVPDFICKYLTNKLVSAIKGNDHERIRDIYCIFKEGNKDWITWKEKEKEYMGKLKILNSRALENIESGEHSAKFLEKPMVSIYDTDFFEFLSIMTSRGDKESQHLENIILKYIPFYMCNKVLSFSPFLEQNEDMYQNMIQNYPDLSRRDALLERLLPCFVTIVMRDINSIQKIDLNMEDSLYLFLCVLNKLCEMKETDLKSITLIFENISKNLQHNEFAFDIVSKYPQVKKLLLEYCYKIINSLCCTPVPEFSLQSGTAACIIGKYKGVWYGLKPLLIVLRTLKRELLSEYVNMALKLKGIRGYNPFFIIEHDYLRYFSDKSLKELRQEMANGLSDWLKPLPNSKRGDLNKRLENYPPEEREMEGFDIDYTEPNPIWRYAYVRAIADLGVDVDGKGHYIHSIIDKVAQEDPSEIVREAAVRTSSELKNLRDGWDKGVHTIKILQALWWFRQASRLAMNLPVDRVKALSTRDGIWASFLNDNYPVDTIFRINKEKSVKDEINQAKEKLMRARFGI